jgi:transcriptional regulator with XRE-family HTH domain
MKMQVAMTTPKPDKDVIRENLAKFRAECELSRADLAALSGIPEKNIVRGELGETGISSSALIAFAHVFGRDPGDFYKADPPPAPKAEDRPKLFLRQWPGVDVPREILDDVRLALSRANEKLRGKKHPK